MLHRCICLLLCGAVCGLRMARHSVCTMRSECLVQHAQRLHADICADTVFGPPALEGRKNY